RGFLDRFLSMVVMDSQAPHAEASPAEVALAARLEAIVGSKALDSAMFDLTEIGGVRNALKEKFGAARSDAIEASLRKSNMEMALRLLDDPNPALGNTFGEALSAGVADLITKELGGAPRDPKRAKLAADIADKVGRDVLENAYLNGDVETLRTQLEAAI